MLDYDDLGLTELSDPRVKLIISMLKDTVYGEARVSAVLESAGLSPGDYRLGSARVTWTEAVPDAARQGKLGRLVACVTATNQAFGIELERQMRPLLMLPGAGSERAWYRCDDPFACGFVGAGAGRAVIDRSELRRGLHDLAAGAQRVLIVTGEPGTGKTHSWLLIDHLREAASMGAPHKFFRVTTHSMAGEVTGEALALRLALRLRLNVSLAPSSELDDTRICKILDMIVADYPDDGVMRWIVLDGLDRPLVQETARDVARQLISLVSDNELRNTKLIITGFDMLGLVTDYPYHVEQIPPIDEMLVSTFLATVAGHLGCDTSPRELAALVAEVVEAGGESRRLREMERAVVQLARKHWARESGDGSW